VCVLAKLQSTIAIFTGSCLVCVASSPANIGFLVTSGQAVVDGAVLRGNSTLFPGNLVRAGDTASDIVLAAGTNLLLQPGGEARVFRDYGILQHGSAIQHGTHPLVADGLSVASLSPQGAVLVDVQDASHLRILAKDSAAEVHNAAGQLVARLEPGKPFSFVVQAPPQQAAPSNGAAAPPAGTQMTVHGILRKDHPGRYGHFLLTDLASKITYELQGAGLDDLVGASVEATGSTFETPPAPGASQVLSISDVHQMPLSEIQQEVPGLAPAPASPATPAEPATPPNATPDIAPPGASNEPAPPTATAPAAPAPAPETPAEASPAEASVPQPLPIPQHSNTPKILAIVALAGGAVVGVALGLGGGKSSTVSPE
jgi:hypothetical protein